MTWRNCITIFWYSNQEADTSDNSSGRVVTFLVNTFHITDNMDKQEAEDFCGNDYLLHNCFFVRDSTGCNCFLLHTAEYHQTYNQA